MATIYLNASNVLTFFQETEATRPPGLKIGIASNVLQLSQSASTQVKVLSASNHLSLSQEVKPGAVLHLSASNYLELHQSVVRPIILYVGNTLVMSQSASNAKHLLVNQTLNLTQSATVSRGLGNTLNLTQEVKVNIVKVINVSHVLNLVSEVAAYRTGIDFIGITVPPFVTPQAVVLSGSNLSVTLTVPQIGDSDSIEHARINRESRAGTLIVFRDPLWPKTEILKMKFENMTTKQRDDFLQFMNVNTGKQVTLTDHQGQDWSGVILNPDAEVIQTGMEGECYVFETELEFQGAKI